MEDDVSNNSDISSINSAESNNSNISSIYSANISLEDYDLNEDVINRSIDFGNIFNYFYVIQLLQSYYHS